MGTKYSSVSVSGYNSSPPADDGTQVASNQVSWAKHKQKLGDPLKTALEAINTGLVTALDQSVRQVSVSGGIVASDHDKTIEIASSITAVISLTLAAASSLASGFVVTVNNQSNVVCAIGRAGASDTFNGETSNISIMPLESIKFVVNAGQNGFLAWRSMDARNPCFLAYNSVDDNSQTGAGTEATVDFDTEVFDSGSDFATDTFTAPATGRYLLSTSVQFTNTTTAMTEFELSIVTSNRTFQSEHVLTVLDAGNRLTMPLTVVADMDAGDTATVTMTIRNGAGDTAGIAGSSSLISNFSGVRVA